MILKKIMPVLTTILKKLVNVFNPHTCLIGIGSQCNILQKSDKSKRSEKRAAIPVLSDMSDNCNDTEN